MNKKDEKGKKETKDQESFSDSAELFDTIFTRIKDSEGEASDSGKRKQDGGRKPFPDETATPGRPEPPGSPPLKVGQAGEKGEAGTREIPPSRGKWPPSSRKPARKLNPLTLALAAVLLIVLAGAGTLYLGIIDFGTLTGSSEQAGMAGIQKKVPERALVRKSAKRPEEKREPAVPREGEVPGMPAKKLEPVPPIKGGSKPDSGKIVSPEEPSSVRMPPPSAAGTGAGEASAPKAVPFSESSDPHPYSIYLGSFRRLNQVEKAMSGYRRMGLSPYWLRMDLGDKGIWFRIFANHFKTREEADAFIKARKIADARSRHTKYAVLTGVYTSEEELNTGRSALLELGYSPYRIQGEKGVARLYVGAFYQRDQAEKQRADLASRGIEGRTVER
jgi:cell division septation protein DedD